MPINLLCPNCKTAHRLDDSLAGQTITCSQCQSPIAIPLDQIAAGPLSHNPRFDRVLGRPVPLFLDILGLHTRWSDELTNRDIFLFVWSLRHLFLLFLACILFFHFHDPAAAPTGNPAPAQAAPWFFFLGIVILVISWLQVSRISRNLTTNITARRSPAILPRILSAALVVVTDFRASLPALRTLLLACVLIFSGLQLASDSGGWIKLLHLPSFNLRPAAATHPYRPPESETPVTPTTTPAPAPPKPSPEDLPLPPPDDPDTPPAK